MDMQAKHQDPLIFHLTGQRVGDSLCAVDGLGLRPALLAAYRDLPALRHDFPLVLAERARGPACLRTLSGLVDAMLRSVAPRGVEGERLRRHALQLETEIRRAMAGGATGTLRALWDAAAARLGERQGETLEEVLLLAGGELGVSGELVDCTPEMPARLVTHAWRVAQRDKARRFQLDLSRLVEKLSDILRAAFVHSQAGVQPGSLKAALGGPHQATFDFEALSRIVGKGVPQDELPASRRARIERTLAVLESQRFFALLDAGGEELPGRETYGFEYASCQDAAEAFRERLAAAADLVKAMSIAELEILGRYDEEDHDVFFAHFGPHSLTADDLARLPDYLVCIPPERNDAAENANLMEMLSSGLPVKVLVQTSDLLEQGSIGTHRFAFGVRSARLATTAMGLGGMFVLQSAASNLYAVREQLLDGLARRGPALFSVFVGARRPSAELANYLTAAAAMHSRAFPSFVYDAGAGGNWATRFSLANNPQPQQDWPVETLEYADAALQRDTERCAFTFADFALCDERHAAHFALVPHERWSAAMMPVADWLALDEAQAASLVPYLSAVDREDRLQRVVVSASLMQATRRCLLLWRRLQEHGGIHNSHAEALLARERAAWIAEQKSAAAPPAAAASEVPVAPGAAAFASAEPEPAEPVRSRDEAWIETARCPSCNECQLINDRMFGYDDKKQAFIKDLKAGTYRQMVEAAESCQVAIIHPGAPWDPNEAGLEELLARAEAFR